MSITGPPICCAAGSGASTRRTPTSCGASGCSSEAIFLLAHELADQCIDPLRRLDVRRVPDAGKRAVFGARESRGDRLAAGLGSDGVLAAAGDQHRLLEESSAFSQAAI